MASNRGSEILALSAVERERRAGDAPADNWPALRPQPGVGRRRLGVVSDPPLVSSASGASSSSQLTSLTTAAATLSAAAASFVPSFARASPRAPPPAEPPVFANATGATSDGSERLRGGGDCADEDEDAAHDDAAYAAPVAVIVEPAEARAISAAVALATGATAYVAVRVATDAENIAAPAGYAAAAADGVDAVRRRRARGVDAPTKTTTTTQRDGTWQLQPSWRRRKGAKAPRRDEQLGRAAAVATGGPERRAPTPCERDARSDARRERKGPSLGYMPGVPQPADLVTTPSMAEIDEAIAKALGLESPHTPQAGA